MKILIIDPIYSSTGEFDDAFREKLASELRAEIGDLTLTDVDAGPGASEPAYFLEIVGHVANVVSLALAAPILWQGLLKWIDAFNRVAAALRGRNLRFSVDAASVQNLAAFYVLNKIGKGGYQSLSIAAVTRHFQSPGFMSSENIDLESTTAVVEDASLADHYQAVKQNRSRYIVGVEIDGIAYTVVIESDGRCGYVEAI